MSPQLARRRYEDFEDFDDVEVEIEIDIDGEWANVDGPQRIRRRDRENLRERPRRDGKRDKRDRRWQPPPHKREEH